MLMELTTGWCPKCCQYSTKSNMRKVLELEEEEAYVVAAANIVQETPVGVNDDGFGSSSASPSRGAS